MHRSIPRQIERATAESDLCPLFDEKLSALFCDKTDTINSDLRAQKYQCKTGTGI